MFMEPKIQIPKLEAISRDNAEDILKYLAFRKQMVIYLRKHGILEFAEGTAKSHKQPNEKKPTEAKISHALRLLAENQRNVILKNNYKNLIKLKRSHERYDKYMSGRNSTMAVLGLSLNNEGTLEFIKDENDNDIDDPAVLLRNMDNYFLENSEIVIQNLRNEVKNMKLKKDYSVEDVGNDMKKIYRYLKALGRPEDEESKKFNLSTTIVNFKHTTAEQKQCVLNVVGRGDAYTEMNLDGMIQALKSLERIFKSDQSVNIVSPVLNKNESVINNNENGNEMTFYANTRKRGRFNKNDKNSNASKKNFKFNGKCFCCGGFGHKTDNCPSEECDKDSNNNGRANSSDKRPRDKTYTMFDGPDTDDSDVEASM